MLFIKSNSVKGEKITSASLFENIAHVNKRHVNSLWGNGFLLLSKRKFFCTLFLVSFLMLSGVTLSGCDAKIWNTVLDDPGVQRKYNELLDVIAQ